MNIMPLIEIFCDGNEQIGYGHIKRSCELASYLEKFGLQVRLTGLSDTAKKLLPVSHHTSEEATIALFDCMEGMDKEILAVKQKGIPVVTLDWFGKETPDVNIVIYPHHEVLAKKEKHIGFEYIIIRNDIASLKPIALVENKKNALVCIGGGDLLGQAHKAANTLTKLGYDVTLVQGPLAKDKSETKEFKVVVNPPNFPQLLKECDIAVTNGGGCLFEALYLGKPTIVLPQTDYEMSIAQYAKQTNALLGIGIENIKLFSHEECISASENGKKLIDGKGLERICSIIKKLI